MSRELCPGGEGERTLKRFHSNQAPPSPPHCSSPLSRCLQTQNTIKVPNRPDSLQIHVWDNWTQMFFLFSELKPFRKGSNLQLLDDERQRNTFLVPEHRSRVQMERLNCLKCIMRVGACDPDWQVKGLRDRKSTGPDFLPLASLWDLKVFNQKQITWMCQTPSGTNRNERGTA